LAPARPPAPLSRNRRPRSSPFRGPVRTVHPRYPSHRITLSCRCPCSLMPRCAPRSLLVNSSRPTAQCHKEEDRRAGAGFAFRPKSHETTRTQISQARQIGADQRPCSARGVVFISPEHLCEHHAPARARALIVRSCRRPADATPAGGLADSGGCASPRVPHALLRGKRACGSRRPRNVFATVTPGIVMPQQTSSDADGLKGSAQHFVDSRTLRSPVLSEVLAGGRR